MKERSVEETEEVKERSVEETDRKYIVVSIFLFNGRQISVTGGGRDRRCGRRRRNKQVHQLREIPATEIACDSVTCHITHTHSLKCWKELKAAMTPVR